MKTETLITHIHFNEAAYSAWDFQAHEMNYIRQKNKDKDLMDIMYDCYRLGFAKGEMKAKEGRKENNE
jgi:NifB/MoaA-like Fe-S oxidoreductase